MNVGPQIRKLRLERGLSQGDVEKRTGILRCYQSRIEHGKTSPGIDLLQKMATAFGVRVSEFLPASEIQPSSVTLSQGEKEFLIALAHLTKKFTPAMRVSIISLMKNMVVTAQETR